MSVPNRFVAALVLTVLLLTTPLAAHAASAARVTQTHPSADASLARGESFWVRIDYTTDEPISLWARPFRDGAQVEQAMSNASLKHAGSDEALGWFALNEPGEVDEVRIIAGGGKPYREWDLSRH